LYGLDAERRPDKTYGSVTSASKECTRRPSSTNFTVLPTFHDRSLSLGLRKHLVVRGNVAVSDRLAACGEDVQVRIQRKVGGDWHTIASTFTDSAGLFREPNPRPRRNVPGGGADGGPTNDVCRRAVSPVVVNA
jgi:hypothetical protein